VEIFNIKIKDEYKNNFFKLFLFIFLNINKYTFLPVYCVLLFALVILNLFKALSISPASLITALPLIIIFSLSLTIEETFHAAILIIQGRPQEVNSICFNMLKLRNFRIIGIGVSVYFKGSLTENDILHISLAGSIMSLIAGIIFIIAFYLINILLYVFGYDTLLFLNKIVIGGFLLLPVSSLIPFSISSLKSDGYKILQIKQNRHLTNKVLIKAISGVIRYSISYIKQSI
jgi:hypothetical protein